MSKAVCLFLAAIAGVPLMAQFYPEDAQVNLYFPHLADGGTTAQRWQTRFTFVNPSATTTAEASLYRFSDNGSPWSLDLGSGPRSELDFSVPPQARVTFTSKVASSQLNTGWAYAFSSMPLQATVVFRALNGSTPTLDLTAPTTLPSALYRSAGNRNLGIALANQYNVAMTVSVTALNQTGAAVGSAQVSLPAGGHQSFTLGQLIPSLPAGFLGSVVIAPATQAEETWQFLAWTANEDSGMLSTLPPGRAEWPISHWDRIWLVFLRVLDAARQDPLYKNVNFDGAQGVAQGPVQLDTPFQFWDANAKPPQYDFNADSAPTGVIRIPYSLSELISDSPSEIAFIVAHELGHQIQFRIRGAQPVFANLTSDIETDADIVGMLLAMEAGYDPYAAAGALAKLAMGNGQASPLDQQKADTSALFDNRAHPSYGTRINGLWSLLRQACGTTASATCQQYKNLVHPDFPSYAPLFRPGQSQPSLRPSSKAGPQ